MTSPTILRALAIRAIGRQAHLPHREEHAPIGRLQTVTHIRQRAPDDHAHRVIHVRALHLVFDVDGQAGLGLIHALYRSRFTVHGSTFTVRFKPLNQP
jgi:hypothetical protein